jgi:hypothetical protein
LPGLGQLRAGAIAPLDVDCGRRIALLYSGGGPFACRHCYRLAYASQNEAVPGRAGPASWADLTHIMVA